MPDTTSQTDQVIEDVQPKSSRFSKVAGGTRTFIGSKWFHREHSGLTLALLLAGYQWGYPWKPQTMTELYFVMLFGMAVLVWYNYAQRNALKLTTEDADLGDDKQAARDNKWSRIPYYVILMMVVLTVVGLVLKGGTDVFNDPSKLWIEQRMIVTWDFGAYLFLAYLVIRGDLGPNVDLFSRFTRLAGTRQRFDKH